jgi:hypothetical protein
MPNVIQRHGLGIPLTGLAKNDGGCLAGDDRLLGPTGFCQGISGSVQRDGLAVSIAGLAGRWRLPPESTAIASSYWPAFASAIPRLLITVFSSSWSPAPR